MASINENNKGRFSGKSKGAQNQQSKYFFPALLTIALFCFVLYYFKVSRDILSKDRSETYNVKVLPTHLDETGLDALEKLSFSYLAIIDAGSSGCRAHVYRYGKLGSLEGDLYILPRHLSFKVKPGLSSFASKPTEAGASLTKLVDFLKSEIPESLWKDTPIWLKATAGLRLLDKSVSEQILDSVRQELGNSPFFFRPHHAKIISGNEEGAFGWIAFNYLKKVIGPKRSGNVLPYAVVEMGGASSQVTQLAPTNEDAEKIPDDFRYTFTIGKEVYHLYTYSYLGYGAEQGREALTRSIQAVSEANTVNDPCIYQGYSRNGETTPRKETYEGAGGSTTVVGGATSGSCVHALKTIFNTDSSSSSCSNKPGPHSFNCIHQPSFVASSPNFLVFENFFYVSSGLNLPAEISSNEGKKFPLITSPQKFLNAASNVCNMTWTRVQANLPLDDQGKDNNIKWCFSASYAYTFLTEGLKLPVDKRITVQKFVDESEIEWALGAGFKEASDFLKRTHLRPQN